MKVSIKNQTKFQKRYGLISKQSSIQYTKRVNQGSFLSKYRFFKKQNIENSQKDLHNYSLNKTPQHLTLMNLGVQQDQYSLHQNSTCTTKRIQPSKLNNQAKVRLMKITNSNNHLDGLNFTPQPDEMFKHITFNSSNKKQKILEFIKKKRCVNKDIQFNQNIKQKQGKKLFCESSNFQPNKTLFLQRSNPISRTKRNHKKKVLNFFSNSILKNKQLQKEEFISRQKENFNQKSVQKYKFQNLKLNKIGGIKTPEEYIQESKRHNRYDTHIEASHFNQETQLIKNSKASTSLFTDSPCFQPFNENKIMKIKLQSLKLKKTSHPIKKEKTFRTQCLSPWNQNDYLTHHIEDIF